MSASSLPTRAAQFDLAAHPVAISIERLGQSYLQNEGARTNDFVALLYVDRGEGSIRQGPRVWELTSGSLMVIAPGEVHGSHDVGQLDGWLLSFMPGALVHRSLSDSRLPRPGDPLWFVLVRAACLSSVHEVPLDERQRWERHLEELMDELDRRSAGYQQAARALATLVVINTARLVLVHETVPHGGQRVVADVFAFIEEHFCEPISLDDVARALARSAPSLARTVRRFTGRTVNDWIAERRMAEARRLLAETDDGVDRIAAQTGYRDAGYFGRRFKRVHGAAPADWRRQVQ